MLLSDLKLRPSRQTTSFTDQSTEAGILLSKLHAAKETDDMSQGCTIYTDEIRECTTEAGILLSKLHSAKETADLSQGCTICTDEIRECTNKLLLHFH